MLDEIIKLEEELAQKLARAKHAAAEAIQSARTKAADERVALEEKLRLDEHVAISEAEEEAKRQAHNLVSEAKARVADNDNKKSIENIAKEVLSDYLK